MSNLKFIQVGDSFNAIGLNVVWVIIGLITIYAGIKNLLDKENPSRVGTMSPFVVKHVKEKSIEGSNAKFTWGVKNGMELQRIVSKFSVQQEVSLVEGMKELMSIYHVIDKIPAVRNISNKIIVMKKRG